MSLILSGCKNAGNTTDSAKEAAFRKFVARQRFIDLPVHFDLNNAPDSLTQPLVFDKTDTLFIPSNNASGQIFGIYKDTSKRFLFIALYPADGYIPAIILFDKHGNRLNEEQLLVDGCGADCGYYCNAIADIYKERSSSDILFYTRDSVFAYDCDSLAKPMPGTTQHYVKFKSGGIDSLGRISKKTGKINYMISPPGRE